MPSKLNNFVGVLMSEETDNCLRLAALLQGVSKSTLVRNIIIDKVDDNNWDEDSLIDRYAQIIHMDWSLKFRDTLSFVQYMLSIKKQLKEKSNLPSDLQVKIITKCREKQQNQSKTK